MFFVIPFPQVSIIDGTIFRFANVNAWVPSFVQKKFAVFLKDLWKSWANFLFLKLICDAACIFILVAACRAARTWVHPMHCWEKRFDGSVHHWPPLSSNPTIKWISASFFNFYALTCIVFLCMSWDFFQDIIQIFCFALYSYQISVK